MTECGSTDLVQQEEVEIVTITSFHFSIRGKKIQKPVGEIVRHIKEMGFNCVRLTWATHMVTRQADLRVGESFRRVGLGNVVEGVVKNNPGLVNLTVVDAQRAVIGEIVKVGLMVVLDNHVSRAGWCCSDGDGNGFFGDKDFDADEWLRGLGVVAKRYRDVPMVVAMSLRNELRGPLQNVTAWYHYIEKGAKTINKANPNLLIIISGLHYALNLSFLKQKPLKLKFKNKLVYEIHRYSSTAGQKKLWLNQPFTKACEEITQGINREAGFLLEGENDAPIFVSEFGIKQVEVGRADNLFLGCFLGYLAEMDLDWSVWALQGSYYVRNGVRGLDETYGMLNYNWSSVRNPDFHQKLQLIQQKIQDPNSRGPPYNILYHPSSGHCLGAYKSEVHASDCRSFSKWNYNGNGNPIRLMGTKLCLSAGGNGIPVTLSQDCTSRHTQWELVSNSKFQMANKGQDGKYLCLEWDPNRSSRVFTRKCACLDEDNSVNCQESPQNQWFKLVSANA
ncbi:Cellulase [Handroanthus impetiginosus]|uniref:Cellulase n=1 Tax=Handroanthus impetiginosus TaxID=429701 RepID=A0A2G9GPU8_9LAMI|nr:Cellulase [Handroanthus impetiginosus]